jgi:uncharacterized protein
VTVPTIPARNRSSSEPDLDQVDGLRSRLRELERVVVAFSGGADSAFLAWVAHDTLGDDALAVTAVSPSLPAFELDDCASLADEWGLRWTTVATLELASADYQRNDDQRCFHCKDALMDAVVPLSAARRATVVLGVNLDDLGEHRPGQVAASGRGARFPMVDAGLTKADIRAESRRLGLRTWDKPAAACLSSRVPYGTPVTLGVLRSVERAETGLRSMGFRALRVRHYGDAARIEVPLDDLAAVLDHREAVVDVVRSAGYRYVTVDLEGLRSGNLNQALADRPADPVADPPN